jgi:phosphoglycolate phosphatase
MYDLVLFDLDGTLVNTAPDIADAVNKVLEGRKLPQVSERWVRNRIGHGTRQLLAQAMVAAPRMNPVRMTPELMAQLLDEFAEHYAALCGRRGRLFPEAASVLGTLRTIGVKLALLTNKERRFVRFLLEVHGLDGDFDCEVCGDTLPARKPDPLTVQHCLRTLSVPPAGALLVGDSAVDVETARKAGIAVWAVSYGYNQGQPIGRSKPDRVIGSIADVLEPFADRIHAVGGGRYSPRASSSSLYLRNNPRN